MGFFSKFEGKMEDTFEGAAGKMNNAPISPVQIMKKAEKQMRREKMVSAGREFAPTLYTVLVNADDDQRLFGFYPTLAGETETRLESAASSEGLALDCKPLVRFIVDESLKHGKFDVIAEVVSAPIIAQLRDEEMQRYGMAPPHFPAGLRQLLIKCRFLQSCVNGPLRYPRRCRSFPDRRHRQKRQNAGVPK